VLGAPTDSSLLLSSFSLRCGSAYIKTFVLPFLSFSNASSIFLMVVFLLILRLPEQIASSCSSTCNTCNTAEVTHHDASRVDASLEDVVSSSQAPPSIHSHWIGCWVVPLRLGSPRRVLTLILWASASLSSSSFVSYFLQLLS